ncbi:MAG: AbrB/MazE/SpoVT family DNA-binding domain-containing protein [Thiolinea sp.]
MTIATLRPKGQLTIPARILQQLNLRPYEQVEVNFQNGIITIVPVNRKETTKKDRLKTFAGAGQGCWGDSPEAVNASIHKLRDSWSR